jgi:signal transduction histidine kinase
MSEDLEKRVKELEKERDLLQDNLDEMIDKMEDLNRKLIKSESYRAKFLSLIRNEFNNPISNILNLSKNLIKKSENEKQKFISECLSKESLTLRFQIANIIAATEIESGLFNDECTNINFAELIQRSQNDLEYIIKEKNIDVKKHINLDDKVIQNQEKLYLILINLVSNACEHSRDNGIVEVDVNDKNDNLTIRVKDYGEGIEPDAGDRVYEEFVQLHSGNTRPKQGQGLGLTIVKELSESMGGTISYDSKLEEFTEFNCVIPKVLDDSSVIYSDGVDSFFFDDEFMDDEDDDVKSF